MDGLGEGGQESRAVKEEFKRNYEMIGEIVTFLAFI